MVEEVAKGLVIAACQYRSPSDTPTAITAVDGMSRSRPGLLGSAAALRWSNFLMANSRPSGVTSWTLAGSRRRPTPIDRAILGRQLHAGSVSLSEARLRTAYCSATTSAPFMPPACCEQ